MKKSGELLKVGIVILLAGTIAAGIHIYRNYENHRFDKYLASPEDAVEQCIKEIGSGRNTFPQDVSIYKYVKQKGKNAGAEPEGLVNLYNENLILDKTSSPDRFSEVVERTLWELRYCSFSESEKMIQSAEDEVYYRVKASNEKYNEELWIRLNQASNGLWYISQFTNWQPYSWDGNAPLSEKNKEFGETLIQNITDEEICRMFVHASAMKLNDNLGWDGFHSPSELGWKAYLDFMLGSFDEAELATAYDETLKSYIFTENEIGSYVWQYLGDDEYENNALGSYGYPHTNDIAKEYIIMKNGKKVYAFPEERVLELKTYNQDCMRVTNKAVLENGRTLFEIAYEDTNAEPAVVNTQKMEVRAMESGYRYLSYVVIEPGKESEGNRILDEFAWKTWRIASVFHCIYEDGLEEPELKQRTKSSDFTSMKDSFKQLKVGEELNIEELPENARLTDAWTIEAENNRVRRELEMYSFEAQGNGYLLLRTYFVTLTAGGGNGSVSISINNTQVTQRAFGETYNLFYFDDNQLFQDTVLEVLDSE